MSDSIAEVLAQRVEMLTRERDEALDVLAATRTNARSTQSKLARIETERDEAVALLRRLLNILMLVRDAKAFLASLDKGGE
jgi:hypothetical protein